jgi:predicted NUDIX family NTP pyrophosphohydrolase
MPLTVRRRSNTQYDVLCGAVRIGIIQQPGNVHPTGPQWGWSINGAWNGPPEMKMGGWTDSLDDAKREVAQNWRLWVDAANLEDAAE